jgi:serine/threonine protein kinase/CRP-like cAMP-binding protein
MKRRLSKQHLSAGSTNNNNINPAAENKTPKLSRESKKRREEVFFNEEQQQQQQQLQQLIQQNNNNNNYRSIGGGSSSNNNQSNNNGTSSTSSTSTSSSSTPSSTTPTSPNAAESSMVWRVLKDHFLFSGMRSDEMGGVVKALRLIMVAPNEVVITEGATGDFFYVVQSGKLTVTQQNMPGIVDVLTEGRVFGELALIYDCPRAATVRATEEGATLWALSRAAFRDLTIRFVNENLQKRVAQLRVIPAFASLTDEQLRRVSAVMQEERFPAGTQICYQGQVLVPGVNDKFYTIVAGHVMVTSSPLKRRSSIRQMSAGLTNNNNTLSTSFFLGATATTATTSSSSASTPLSSSNNDFPYPPTSSSPFPATAAPNSNNNNNNNISPLSPTSTSDPPSATSSTVSLGTLGPGEWFGEIALLSDAPRSANVVSLGNMGSSIISSSSSTSTRGGIVDVPGPNSNDTVCLTLSRGAYEQIIYPSPAQAAISGFSEVRKADNHEIKLRHQRDDLAASLTLDLLDFREIIGEGGFSIVRVVVHRVTGEAFALKTMNKADIYARKQIAHVNNERAILLEVSHPFVLSLIKTFEEPNQIHMVVELMLGGELFSRVLQSGGGLPPAHCAFYMACVVEGLDYLHRKSIAYRDLKLENLVIDAVGYLRIVDFGFAKKMAGGTLTRTLCGTPDYLAPEAVIRRGHNSAVDIWGVGVLLYEMLTQYSPFSDPGGDRMRIFQNILKGVHHADWNELARPFRMLLDAEGARGSLSADTIRRVNQDFINVRDILFHAWNPDPLTRVTASALKSHVYFAGVNWAQLRELRTPAPWTPALEGPMDLRYFDVESFKKPRQVIPYEGPVDCFKEFGMSNKLVTVGNNNSTSTTTTTSTTMGNNNNNVSSMMEDYHYNSNPPHASNNYGSLISAISNESTIHPIGSLLLPGGNSSSSGTYFGSNTIS